MAIREAKPRLACEITSQNVIAARARSDGTAIDVHTVRRLNTGMVRPSLSAGNIGDAAGLSQSVEGALSTVGGRKRDVIAILPDAAVRVALLDFDTLPEKTSEAEPIVRFRLRKAVPFDAEHAALSFQSFRRPTTVRVLAAVTPREVLSEYESAFRTAGYEPGVVLPSTLAAMGAVEADRPTLLVKCDGNFVSVAIADRGELVFYRMLDSAAGRTGAALADEVYPSVVFFEDNYSSKIERIILACPANGDELKAALEEQTGVRAESLDAIVDVGESMSGDALPSSALAGVAGALTQR
jgi:type IV pilus assembly protein PilM